MTATDLRQPHTTVAPDARMLTDRQAGHLADLAGVSVKELAGRRIGELDDILRWKIDPELLLFRQVCGRVVRTDPATGVVYGVPNATVHVEDTDCTFLGYFPIEHPWFWWLWPVSCHREELATTVTDECGNFCVYIPRWDIDRVLRLRRQRVCFDDIFKPTIAELLDKYREQRPPFPPHPDPGPLHGIVEREVLHRAADVLPAGVIDRLSGQLGSHAFGAVDHLDELLDAPAFAHRQLQPPMTTAVRSRAEKALLRVPGTETTELVLDRPAVGPFWRCLDVVVAEWMVFFDTPDITFRVTQDTDLDGDVETIYDEGLFDVRWNAGAIPDVVLEASAEARVSSRCHGPDIACVDEPTIRAIGLMPLDPPYHDEVTGYALRVNKPRLPMGRAGDAPTFPAHAPYAGDVQLHGCHHYPGAEHYRVLYSRDGGAEKPFVGLEWVATKLGGGVAYVSEDGAGWYAILDDLVLPHLLLDWRTAMWPNGTYRVRLEVGDAAKNHLAYSDDVAFTIDNTVPTAGFSQLRWREAGGPWLAEHVLPFLCPTIRRPAGVDIEIEVTWFANATHLRDATLGGGGCGGGSPEPILDAGSDPHHDFFHWYTAPGDNAIARVARFHLDASAPEGAYSFTIDAHSRAFNPAGDGGGPSLDWHVDLAYRHAHPSIGVAVIDA